MQFDSEHLDSQFPAVPKWEHIEKLYKWEKNFVICRLYKLTDNHMACYSVCHEGKLGRSSHEPHSSKQFTLWCLIVRNSFFIHSVFIRNKVTYSKVTLYHMCNGSKVALLSTG
jgi:hypothetical protein